MINQESGGDAFKQKASPFLFFYTSEIFIKYFESVHLLKFCIHHLVILART